MCGGHEGDAVPSAAVGNAVVRIIIVAAIQWSREAVLQWMARMCCLPRILTGGGARRKWESVEGERWGMTRGSHGDRLSATWAKGVNTGRRHLRCGVAYRLRASLGFASVGRGTGWHGSFDGALHVGGPLAGKGSSSWRGSRACWVD